ncbi:hypothetical protein D9758_014569 [Tetrapyrgos nigripes]|uniref:Carboxylic ester hydrolase n=1 Tax=Tetrapyrgos nigripes TaxID=182062 RepID=A0A8H5CFD2_9AGAR|nr:hypothetical protein D9758_014569 [Tetrapyrgos nigripes]
MRQFNKGLKSIQDFPDDFDGIVSGAPAINWNNLTAAEKWEGLVHEDVMRQCDEIVGVVEDLIFAIMILLALSAMERRREQAEMIKQALLPLYINGELAFSRIQPGTENPAPSVYNGEMDIYPVEWYRYVVYNDSSYDTNTLNTSSYTLANLLNPFNIATWYGDLSAFRSRQGSPGGKFHGQADDRIAPGNSERYYDHVSQTIGLSLSKMDKFYRFFRISGMGPRSEGSGAWEVGQSLAGAGWGGGDGNGSRGGGDTLVELELDPERNVLIAMVRWVEEDIAPESLLGRKFANDKREQGIEFERRHCRYPSRNTYDGVGDWRSADSWESTAVYVRVAVLGRYPIPKVASVNKSWDVLAPSASGFGSASGPSYSSCYDPHFRAHSPPPPLHIAQHPPPPHTKPSLPNPQSAPPWKRDLYGYGQKHDKNRAGSGERGARRGSSRLHKLKMPKFPSASSSSKSSSKVAKDKPNRCRILLCLYLNFCGTPQTRHLGPWSLASLLRAMTIILVQRPRSAEKKEKGPPRAYNLFVKVNSAKWEEENPDKKGFEQF